MSALPAFAVVLAVLLAFGDRLCRLLGLGSDRPAERFGLALAASFGVLTLAVFLLALPRWVSFGSMLALLGAMAAVAGPAWRELPRWARPGVSGPLGWLSVLVLGLGLIAAMAPPTGIDTLIIHFVTPARWLHEGGLRADPHAYYHRSGGFYFVYLFGMALQNDLLAKLLHFGASTSAALLCGATAERRRAGAGPWALAAALTSPVVAAYLGYEFLELPALMYVAAGLHAAERGWTAAALGFLGFALGVKPSNLAVLVPAGCLAVEALRRREGRGVAWGVAAAAVAAGFWPLWNLGTSGSFFPTYAALEAAEAGKGAASTPAALGRILWWLAAAPPYWSDALGPLLLLGLAGGACFGVGGGRRAAAWAVGGTGFYLAVVALLQPRQLGGDVHSHVRYLSPLLVGVGAPAAGAWLAGLPRGLAWAALLVPALPLLGLKAGRTAVALPAALGVRSADAYLAGKVETYEACRAVNAMPGRLKVLPLIRRTYHLRPGLWEPTALLPDRWPSASDLAAWGRANGITHVLVEPGWLRPSMETYFEGSAFRAVADWPQPDSRRIRLYELRP